jgi:Na+/proline symporter
MYRPGGIGEQIGGIDGLKEKLGPENPVWNLLPSIGETGGENIRMFSITFASFFAYIGLQWWASWYPGAEPGGGGYVAQRMMSVRTERGAVFATLFFQVAHYCLRPWPWIIVALCSMVLYPNLPAADAKLGYVMVMKDFLPTGLRGLMLVAFFAAYMSTIATQLNWGASYIVNDLFIPARKRQGLPKRSDKQLIRQSRLITIVLMILAMAVTSRISSISKVWEFMIECGAGLGLVLILRWFWWRINVWSEISATVTPFVIYAILKFGLPQEWALTQFPNSYFITIGGTTIVWLLITFITRPEPEEHLLAYYKQVRPGGFWSHIATKSGIVVRANTVPLIMAWLSAVVMTYATLFAIGKLIFKEYQEGLIALAVAVGSAFFLWLVMREWELFDSKSEKVKN